MIHHSDDIVVFTDGSSRGNPGPGGFGAIIIAPKNHELGIKNYAVEELGGKEAHTTNNRMELRAAIEALSFLSKVKGQRSIVIFSDSSYLTNGITKWVHGWQKNGWKTAGKREVENRDLWEELIETSRGLDIRWRLIAGHAGVAGNERCDEIATAFADGEKPELYSGNLPNYGVKRILDISQDAKLAQAKSSHHARSNAKPYSYVSSLDGKVVTHATWAECEKRVKGKKARFKKVFSADEEKMLVREWRS